ncbi:DedA family protein, partial [Mangrovactinospora gilvigrisea]|uniref:DedA family protein n=1 Tax=Mangrovactinospora gilvigrisea TaxID=1428644 RepID=UPI000AAC5BEA
MDGIVNWLGGLSGPLVYAVVGALVFAEDGIFVGFVLPGETAVVVGGVLASQGAVSVWWLAVVVVAAAIGGDSVGYEVGRHFGPRILEIRLLRKHRARIDDARAFIRRRGPIAVFLGRFIAFFRAMMPALAGISRMRYPVFLLFNAIGGVVWGVGFTLLGYFAGSAYKQVEAVAGKVVAIVVGVLVVAALVVWRVRRHRKEKAEEAAAEQEGDAAPEPPAEGASTTTPHGATAATAAD